jgi:NADH dehydrogenase
MSSLKVAVDGATGYLGSHLVARLKEQGFDVVALVHPKAKTEDRQFLQNTGADVVELDLTSKKMEGKNQLSNVSVIVHLIGSIAPKRGISLSHLHVEQTNSLIDLAKKANIEKIVMVTALGTDENAPSTYHRTKWHAEKYLINSGIDYVIIRPSLIIGKTCGRRNSKLVDRYIRLIQTKSMVPLVGGGNNKLQPVFIDDLVNALVLAITNSKHNGQVLEIGGDEIVSLKQFVERLMFVCAQSKKTFAIPFFIAKSIAQLLELVQEQPTLSVDQVVMTNSDNICKCNALTNEFGILPHKIDEALKTYITPACTGGTADKIANRC